MRITIEVDTDSDSIDNIREALELVVYRMEAGIDSGEVNGKNYNVNYSVDPEGFSDPDNHADEDEWDDEPIGRVEQTEHGGS